MNSENLAPKISINSEMFIQIVLNFFTDNLEELCVIKKKIQFKSIKYINFILFICNMIAI